MPYHGSGSNNWVKWVLGFIVLLGLVSCVGGVLFSDSYWGNPPLQEALAEKQHIENEALRGKLTAETEKQHIENEITEETWEIESADRRKKIEDDSWARRVRAERNLVWLDRWNQFGIFAVAVAIVALLVVVGARVAIPPVVKAREQEFIHQLRLAAQRVELREREIKLEMKQIERLREERRTKQVCPEQAPVAIITRQPGDNGNKHLVPMNQQMMSSNNARRSFSPQ